VTVNSFEKIEIFVFYVVLAQFCLDRSFSSISSLTPLQAETLQMEEVKYEIPVTPTSARSDILAHTDQNSFAKSVANFVYHH